MTTFGPASAKWGDKWVGVSDRPKPTPKQGWECPKCGAVWSPWAIRCDRCWNATERKEEA